jgi:predicted RNase H-like nuclease
VIVVPAFTDVLALCDGIIAVDMPIGLPSEGRRACDSEARRMLGARRSSVFPVPTRDALAATSFAEVSGLSIQGWNLVPKIREVDACWEPRVRECSPELSFTVLAGAPMVHNKRTPEGRAERLAVLGDVMASAKGAATHDVLDAHACLRTARRVAGGEALELGDGTIDALGRPMRVYA